MFGDFNPRLMNLLPRSSTWTGLQTFEKNQLATTTVSQVKFRNKTPAASGAQQVSPAVEWESNGWATTAGGVSRSVNFKSFISPIQASSNPIGEWKLQYSVNGAAYSDGLQFYTSIQDGVSTPRLKVNGFGQFSGNNSSTIDTLSNLDLLNPSGTRINQTYTFGSTIKGGKQVTSDGATSFYSAGSQATYYFKVGSTIGGQSDVLQIYSGGLYNYGGMFSQGKVTAGQADTTPPAYLNSYGSLALKGVFKNANAELSENETMVYCDASNANICAGTATACSTWTASGEAVCNSHAPVGCSWTAAVTESCATYGGVDLGTCEGVSGCTFESLTCSGAANTDQTTCEAQDDSYGGSCSWDTSTCPSQTSTAACNAIAGCSADVSGDCSTLSDGGGDGTNCATQPECSYNSGDGVCSGTFFVSCSGNLCGGNYYSGNCNGTHEISPAACNGTASCGNILTSGECATEGGGCSWTSGMTITLPSSTLANKGNTSRLYSIVNIGATGTVTIVPKPGGTPADSILGYGSGIVLNTQNERAMLHHHTVFGECSQYSGNQATCESTSGCAYTAAVVCSSFGDESSCNAASGSGCSWNGSACVGAGTSASCYGTFTSSKPWIIHQLSN